MAIIADNHPALSGDANKFWLDELNNSKIILYELDKAIYALTKKEIRQYTINTGQDSQTVSRQDLPQLYQRRDDMLKQIIHLENRLGLNKQGDSIIQVVPVW